MWLAVLLLAILTVGLEILVFGWQDIWLRFELLMVFPLIYKHFLFPVAILVQPPCGLLGTKIADLKLRSPAEGLFLGFFLEPAGVLIEAAMPDEGIWDRNV